MSSRLLQNIREFLQSKFLRFFALIKPQERFCDHFFVVSYFFHFCACLVSVVFFAFQGFGTRHVFYHLVFVHLFYMRFCSFTYHFCFFFFVELYRGRHERNFALDRESEIVSFLFRFFRSSHEISLFQLLSAASNTVNFEPVFAKFCENFSCSLVELNFTFYFTIKSCKLLELFFKLRSQFKLESIIVLEVCGSEFVFEFLRVAFFHERATNLI